MQSTTSDMHVVLLLGCRPPVRKAIPARVLSNVAETRPINTLSQGRTPLQAFRHASQQSGTAEGRAKYLREAVLDAILGSTRKSTPKVRSGIKKWYAFVGAWLTLACARLASAVAA